jgi:hypothetical protein
MPSKAAIETINCEQLATATDRLLLRGRVSKQRPSGRSFSARAQGSWTQVPMPPAYRSEQELTYPAPRASQPQLGRGSQMEIAPRGSQPQIERVSQPQAERVPQPQAERVRQPQAERVPQIAPRGSHPRISRVGISVPEAYETTVVARRGRPAFAQLFAITLVPTLIGLAIGYAALL